MLLVATNEHSQRMQDARSLPLPWKVGELARRTGLSVRALHHYDEIGLLSPSLRSPSGHRLYDQKDVARLQQVQSLRAMGISLDEIKRFLEDREVSPLRVIYLHLARLREHMALQRRLATRLQGVAQQLEAAETVSADELCQLIEGMTMMEKYFTTEQLEEIRQRGEQVGVQRMRDVGAEWAEIIPAVRAEMERGTDPASPKVQELAKRWKGLVLEFTGGNPGISKSLTNMYKAEGPALQEKLGHVPDAAMFEYISRAFAATK